MCMIAHVFVCETMQMCRRMYSYCIGSVCGLCESAEFICFHPSPRSFAAVAHPDVQYVGT